MKQKTPLKRTRINPISKKQQAELRLRARVKFKLIAIYGKKCMTCGNTHRDWRGLSLSHKIPLSRGGKTSLENCLIECYPCHDKYEKKPELREV